MDEFCKKIIEESVERLQGGCEYKDNLLKSKTESHENNLYIASCIAYNYERYIDALKLLIDLYETYCKIDYNLFTYSSFNALSKSDIDLQLLTSVCKVHAEIQDLYDESHIDLLNESVKLYIQRGGTIPPCIIYFLSSLIKDSTIKNVFVESSQQHGLANDFLAQSIDFSKFKGKEIVHCFYNEASGGIGDFLRGSCYLYSLLENEDCNLHLDFSKHDLGAYLSSPSSFKFSASKILDTEKINKSKTSGENYILNIKNNIINVLENSRSKKIFLFTNYSDFIDHSYKMSRLVLTKSCQSFMKNNLIFSTEVEQEFARQVNKNEEYIVMHFRLGDSKMLNERNLPSHDINTKDYNVSMRRLLNVIEHTIQIERKKVMLLSDSNDFKKYAMSKISKQNKKYLQCLHNNSQHSSNNPGSLSKLKNLNKKNKKQNMFYVALDMKLISRASKSFSYSVYPWGSGFVFWTSKIFNVPIITNQIME